MWVEGTMPIQTDMYVQDICYGNGIFVAVPQYPGRNIFYYSTDGINWNKTTNGLTGNNWKCICYGNGKFVALGYSTNSNGKVIASKDLAYSTDGVNWTQTQAIANAAVKWYDICYGNGKFVATVYGTNYRNGSAVYSTDGINWQSTTFSYLSASYICYGNGKFVIVCVNSDGCYSNYSTDGVNWTQGTIRTGGGSSITKICYGSGKYVIIGWASSVFYYSTDGQTWSTTGNGIYTANWSGICYGNGKFIVITGNSSNIYAYSTDGVNWSTGVISPTGRYWWEGCYGNGKFVIANNTNYYFAYMTDYPSNINYI